MYKFARMDISSEDWICLSPRKFVHFISLVDVLHLFPHKTFVEICILFLITSYALKMWSSWHFSCYKFPNYHQHHSLLHFVENIIPLAFMFSNTFGNWRNHLEISRTPSQHSLTFVQYAVLIFDHIVRNQ